MDPYIWSWIFIVNLTKVEAKMETYFWEYRWGYFWNILFLSLLNIDLVHIFNLGFSKNSTVALFIFNISSMKMNTHVYAMTVVLYFTLELHMQGILGSGFFLNHIVLIASSQIYLKMWNNILIVRKVI